MGIHNGADTNLQPMWGPTQGRVPAPEGGWDPMGRSPRCCSSALGGLQHMGVTHTPVGVTHVGADLWRTVSCGRDSTLEQVKTVRSHPLEEEGAAGTMCHEVTTTPIPHPPALLERRR